MVEMVIRPYEDRDIEQLKEWFSAYKMPTPDPTCLPKTGYIAEGIACGFIYLTDSTLAIIDCYISNPKAGKEDRDRALDSITKLLLNYAEKTGHYLVRATTIKQTVKKRAEKFGFKHVGDFSSYFKEI